MPNVHPLVVHFPVALLTIYTLFEIARLPFLTRQPWYFHVKAVMLFIGSLGTFVAMQTGEWAEQGFRGTPTMALVELHSAYATATAWVYAVLAVAYLAAWLRMGNVRLGGVPAFLDRVLFRSWILVPASVVGLVLLTITGALGGALVYGGDVDPVVSFIYNLLYRP